MMRQLYNRQARMANRLQLILFFAAMLVFIFTVVYRMVKSENLNTALATLVESLLIVSFFIFLGIIIAYLIYFLHERLRGGSNRRLLYPLPENTSGDDPSACSPDFDSLRSDSEGKAESPP